MSNATQLAESAHAKRPRDATHILCYIDTDTESISARYHRGVSYSR